MDVLVLLFAKYLFRLLASANQVGHHLLSWAKRYVLIYLITLVRQIASDLV